MSNDSEAEERAKRLCVAYFNGCQWATRIQAGPDWIRVEACARDLYEAPLRARIAELEAQNKYRERGLYDASCEIESLRRQLNVRALLARAESAERARCEAEIAKLREAKRKAVRP